MTTETVRCKVRLNYVQKGESQHWNAGMCTTYLSHTANFSFVSAGSGPNQSEENRRFWEATPNGKFEVVTSKEMPWTIGEEFYLDIVPVAAKQD